MRLCPISASGNRFDPDVDRLAISIDDGGTWSLHDPPGQREWNPDLGATDGVRLVNAEEATRLSRGDVALKDGPLDLSGRALMSHGLSLPVSFPERMWVVEGERL